MADEDTHIPRIYQAANYRNLHRCHSVIVWAKYRRLAACNRRPGERTVYTNDNRFLPTRETSCYPVRTNRDQTKHNIAGIAANQVLQDRAAPASVKDDFIPETVCFGVHLVNLLLVMNDIAIQTCNLTAVTVYFDMKLNDFIKLMVYAGIRSNDLMKVIIYNGIKLPVFMPVTIYIGIKTHNLMPVTVYT